MERVVNPVRIIKTASGAHVALVAAAVYYTMRINNHASLSELSNKETTVMAGMALLPIASAWIGIWLARGATAQRLMAIGQTVAMLLFAATFVLVLDSVEPMAPLLLLLVSLWLAAGLAVLLIVVWLVGRSQG